MTDGRTARAKAQREERRAQILDVAVEVFAHKGYHRTSISDLVAAAGVARGTFYQYFDSKHAIFHELLERLLTGFRGSVVGVDTAEGAPPLHEQLVGTVSRILTAASSNRDVATLIFREALALDEEVDRRLQAFEERLHTYVQASLQRGIDMGLLRDHDTEVVATCVYGSIRQVIERRTLSEAATDTDPDLTAREIVTFALAGVVRQA